MSKMSELSAILDEMIECGNGLVKAATALRDYYFSTAEQDVKPGKTEVVSTAPSDEAKTYSKEDVRALLAQKANESDGKYKSVVKELVKKYSNGGTLKDIAPENYASLVAELEVATNG